MSGHLQRSKRVLDNIRLTSDAIIEQFFGHINSREPKNEMMRTEEEVVVIRRTQRWVFASVLFHFASGDGFRGGVICEEGNVLFCRI